MRFTKAKIVAAGMILAGICMIAPQQLRAEVPKTQMDGVMGQSIKEEMDDTQISDVDTQRDGLLSTYAIPRLLGASKASSGYTQDFLMVLLLRKWIIQVLPIITNRTMKMRSF